jgi:hypothetical protein
VPDSLSPPPFKMALARMYRRVGVDALPAHLAEVLGISVTKVQQLDVGVFRVDHVNGPPLVARLFSSLRSEAAPLGDLRCSNSWSRRSFRPNVPSDPFPSQRTRTSSCSSPNSHEALPNRLCRQETRSWAWVH